MTQMAGMEGMAGAEMLGPWSAGYLGATLAMWTAMMATMMLPSALPMVRLFAMSSRRAAAQGRVAVPTALFVVGYLFIWTLFSVGATALQALLRSLAVLSSDMSLVLFAVGVMSLGWVVALAAFVLLEKTGLRSIWPSRLADAGLVGGAIVLLLR